MTSPFRPRPDPEGTNRLSVIGRPSSHGSSSPGSCRIREAIQALNPSDLYSSKSELLLQLLAGNRRRTAEPEDGLGKWADNRVHGRVLPMHRPTIGKEVRSDDRSVIHDHRGSMPPKDLGTARDVIEVERTDRGRHPDIRHPMHMTAGDHHVGPTGSPAVEIPCRRDVCAPAGRENLLVPGQAFADRCSTVPHEVAEVGHLVQRRPSRARLKSERARTFLNDIRSDSPRSG
jgi:hypothetical protein